MRSPCHFLILCTIACYVDAAGMWIPLNLPIQNGSAGPAKTVTVTVYSVSTSTRVSVQLSTTTTTATTTRTATSTVTDTSTTTSISTTTDTTTSTLTVPTTITDTTTSTTTVPTTITDTSTTTDTSTSYGINPASTAAADAKCQQRTPGSSALYKANGKPGCCVPVMDANGNRAC